MVQIVLLCFATLFDPMTGRWLPCRGPRAVLKCIFQVKKDESRPLRTAVVNGGGWSYDSDEGEGENLQKSK